MALTKSGVAPNAGPTGIPYTDPVTLDQGGPAGVGGSANTVNSPRVKATEPAGSGTPGAGSNTDLFNPWGGNAAFENSAADSETGETGSTSQDNQGPSNVNKPYPAANHLISGTHLPTTPSEAPTGSGRIMRGGRGRPGK
jgi:hypothetical protein